MRALILGALAAIAVGFIILAGIALETSNMAAFAGGLLILAGAMMFGAATVKGPRR